MCFSFFIFFAPNFVEIQLVTVKLHSLVGEVVSLRLDVFVKRRIYEGRYDPEILTISLQNIDFKVVYQH